MSEFERKNESTTETGSDSERKSDGFAVNNGCENEYEKHEDHSYSRNTEENYSRGEHAEYYTSGSGNFYRREHGASGQDASEPENKKTNGLAIASMVCGIIALIGCCIPYLSVILSILGLIFGIITIVKGFNGFSLAGIIVSSFALVFAIISLIVTLSAIGNWFDFIQSIIDSSSDDPFDPNFGASIDSLKLIFKRL